MKNQIHVVLAILILLIAAFGFSDSSVSEIPKVWDMEALLSMQLPYPDTSVVMKPASEEYYYALPERVVYKTYPFYMPGREPKGYFEWLRTQKPEIIFNVAEMKTEQDWINAGEIMYDMPQTNSLVVMDSAFLVALPELEKLWRKFIPPTKDGTIPFLSIVVREKGRIELGNFSCGMCHTKLMPDGSLLKGGQGNFIFSNYFASMLRMQRDFRKTPDSIMNIRIKSASRLIFEAPWVKHESQARLKTITVEEWLDSFETRTGVTHRQGSALGYPVNIPDLFNLKERKYFDHTGQLQHRDMGDLMRYATLNQNVDRLNNYNGFTAFDAPANPEKSNFSRFSDEQLYALAKYMYTLKPARNPVVYPKALLEKGEMIFKQQGCVTCHTPPLYSNNKLTPVDGFEPPEDHLAKYNIFNISVGTDPTLALHTRRGSGYYKVPSLIGVWNRTAFMHNGALGTLEDMFDRKRLEQDYIPTGFKPLWLKTMAVAGHPFGLELNAADKTALVAYLKSL